MTYSNYTRNILNIKDENIIFEENCLEITKIKNTTVKIFHGKLTYTLLNVLIVIAFMKKILKQLLNMALKKIVKSK